MIQEETEAQRSSPRSHNEVIIGLGFPPSPARTDAFKTYYLNLKHYLIYYDLGVFCLNLVVCLLRTRTILLCPP